MGEINYIRGDATTPSVKGVKLIAHVCNDIGGWGKGFVVAVSRRWPEPEGDVSTCGEGRALKGRGELRGQPRPARSRPLSGGPVARGCRPTRQSGSPCLRRGLGGGRRSRVGPKITEQLIERCLAVTVHDHGED